MIHSTKGYATKLRRFSLKTQKLKSKITCEEITGRKLSSILAALQLKTLYYNDDTIKLINHSTTVQNSIINNTLPMINLCRLHSLINTSNLCSVQHLDFAMCKRNNFTCKHLTSSLMRIMSLGKENMNVFI